MAPIRPARPSLNRQGQAVTEYILLLSIVVSVYFTLSRFLSGSQFGLKFTRIVTQDFVAAYRYGHPKAKGFDEDQGPKNHPRADRGENGNRLFFNPTAR